MDYPYSTPAYPFVNLAANVLQFPGSADALAPLYAKMDRLLSFGEGQVNMVHIGGSHVQADMWTDRLRQRFQTAFDGGRGGRGFIFPYRMAGTNGPYGYMAEHTGKWEACKNIQANRACTLGLSGYVVTTTDTLSTIRFSFRDAERPHYDFNRIRVFHDLDSSSYQLQILVNGQPVLSRQLPALACTEFDMGGFAQTLQLEIRKTDSLQTHFSLYGLTLENPDPGFVYHAIGVNGASTGSYRRCQLFIDVDCRRRAEPARGSCP